MLGPSRQVVPKYPSWEKDGPAGGHEERLLRFIHAMPCLERLSFGAARQEQKKQATARDYPDRLDQTQLDTTQPRRRQAMTPRPLTPSLLKQQWRAETSKPNENSRGQMTIPMVTQAVKCPEPRAGLVYHCSSAKPKKNCTNTNCNKHTT